MIFNSDGVTLADANNPASVGETIVIYCTGLGEVSPSVVAGMPAPSSPPAMTVNPVTVTIAGIDAPVSFAGLAPGFAGLYQVNAIVPVGADAGDGTDVPLLVTVKGRVSPAVKMRRPGPPGGTGKTRSPSPHK